MKLKAFTLAELLIALAVLGVIATFTIPKLLTSQGNQQQKAVWKETLSALSDATANGYVSGELAKGAVNWNDNTYYLGKLNAIKVCPTDSSAQGCWGAGVPEPTPGITQITQTGVVLANGAVITGLGPSQISQDHNWATIDVNGALPPNAEGQDQMVIYLCYGKACALARAGTVTPVSTQAASVTLYNSIFAN